jgi:hypothetical protein
MGNKLNIHKKLYTILIKIRRESPIAREILSENPSNLLENHADYINISNDLSKITYLNKKKIESTLVNIAKENNIRRSDIGEYSLPSDLFFKNKSRVQIKYGSFINKLFTGYTASEIEKFTSLFKAVAYQKNFTFKVVSGKEISEYYMGDHHASGRGSLGVSCMRHQSCKPYFNMYVNNPDTVKLLIMFDAKERILARTLLWDLDESNECENFKFMDRVYYSKDDQLFHFIEWANNNGYAYKEKQSWDTPYRFTKGGENFDKLLKIKLLKPSLNDNINEGGKGLPYLDTLKWIDIKTGYMYNYKPEENTRNIYTLVSTNGTLYGFNYLKEDTIKREFGFESEVKRVAYKDGYSNIKHLNYSKVNNTYILKTDCEYNNDLKDFLFNDDFKKFNDSYKINELIDIINEKKRLLKIKQMKAVQKTIPYFKRYKESSIKYFKGISKSIKPKYSDLAEKSLSSKVPSFRVKGSSSTIKGNYTNYKKF